MGEFDSEIFKTEEFTAPAAMSDKRDNKMSDTDDSDHDSVVNTSIEPLNASAHNGSVSSLTHNRSLSASFHQNDRFHSNSSGGGGRIMKKVERAPEPPQRQSTKHYRCYQQQEQQQVIISSSSEEDIRKYVIQIPKRSSAKFHSDGGSGRTMKKPERRATTGTEATQETQRQHNKNHQVISDKGITKYELQMPSRSLSTSFYSDGGADDIMQNVEVEPRLKQIKKQQQQQMKQQQQQHQQEQDTDITETSSGEDIRRYYNSLTIQSIGTGWFDQRLAALHEGIDVISILESSKGRTFFTSPRHRDASPYDIPARHPLRALAWILFRAQPGSTVRVYCATLSDPMAIDLLIHHGADKNILIIMYPGPRNRKGIEDFFNEHGRIARRAFRDLLQVRMAMAETHNRSKNPQMHDNSWITEDYCTFGSYDLSCPARYQSWESLYVADTHESQIRRFDAIWESLADRVLDVFHYKSRPSSPEKRRTA